jgi:hypothetical protein
MMLKDFSGEYKKIRRKNWVKEEYTIIFTKKRLSYYVWKYTKPTDTSITLDDMCADDWEVFVEPLT